MNLLELMLSRHVMWPIGMRWAVQDRDGEVKFAANCPPKPPMVDTWDRDQETKETKELTIILNTRAEDWRNRVVERNEYQAAGGWMEWEGGECPVPKETPIMYTTKRVVAEKCVAGACSWRHIGDDSDILAYCVTAIIPERNPETVVRALERLYAKLGVTTLEGAFAKIDEGILASAKHTIVHGPDTFKDSIILLRSRQTVVWTHNGKEYISPLTEVLIDPDKDELAAHLLSGLCKVQIAPIHIAEVRKQVGWVYPEND